MSCINCEYARRAENNEYVGCCLLVKLSYEHPARFAYEGDQLFDFYEKRQYMYQLGKFKLQTR